MRYELVRKEQIRNKVAPDEFAEIEECDYPEILWDRQEQKVAWWANEIQPEDATLDRAFHGLIDLLNKGE